MKRACYQLCAHLISKRGVAWKAIHEGVEQMKVAVDGPADPRILAFQDVSDQNIINVIRE